MLYYLLWQINFKLSDLSKNSDPKSDRMIQNCVTFPASVTPKLCDPEWQNDAHGRDSTKQNEGKNLRFGMTKWPLITSSTQTLALEKPLDKIFNLNRQEKDN